MLVSCTSYILDLFAFHDCALSPLHLILSILAIVPCDLHLRLPGTIASLLKNIDEEMTMDTECV